MSSLKKRQNELSKVYYNIKEPAGFASIAKLSQRTGNNTKATKSWLSAQPAYSLNRPFRKSFPTRRYKASGINHVWQLDLMEMIPYATINKGYRYILTSIDVFSRFAQALPIKTKSSNDIVEPMHVLLGKSKPLLIQTDLGKEFYDIKVKSFLKQLGINHYSVHSQFKAPIVERFNRTLRDKLKRYFTHTGTKIWYRALPDIIKSYNSSKHRGIYNLRPIDITSDNEFEIWSMQNKDSPPSTPPKHKLLEYVRISRITNSPFIKNFNQNWSEEVFRIVGIDHKESPETYIIEDLKNNVIEGKFYRQELQVISSLPTLFRIERIISSKGRGKQKQYLVKWHGYLKEHNSWINANQL